MDTVWIIAYSKYSKTCDELFRTIESLDVPTPFQYLEIDNKQLRNRIKQTTNFAIQYVPCIISINAMGIASQYEGEKAFEIVRLMQPQPQPRIKRQVRTIEPELEEEQSVPLQSKEIAQGVTLIENLAEEEPSLQESKSPAIKGNKLSVSEIMKNAKTEEPTRPFVPTVNFEQKKTGGKISVSEIMSQVQ